MRPGPSSPSPAGGEVVELDAILVSAAPDPTSWARRRETEGWHGVAVADHLVTGGRPYPHLWVAATAAAAATRAVRVTSAFANNLFRSPVEFAQAAVTLAVVSGGRFEAGLGAGWARDELETTGRSFPSPGERVERYVEALQIVRALLHEGRCDFDGAHHQVHLDTFPSAPVTPPLVGSLGGPRMMAEASPFVDRIELKPASRATRDGALDMAALAQVRADHVDELVEAAHRHRPDVPLSMFVLCGVAEGEAGRAMAANFDEGSLFGGFFGEPARVLDSILALGDAGIDRVSVSPIADDGYELLAEAMRSAGVRASAGGGSAPGANDSPAAGLA